MPIGPEPSFAPMALATVDMIQANVDRPSPNKINKRNAMIAVFDLGSASITLAQLVSDLLYLIENDPPESERTERTLRELRNAIHPKQLETYYIHQNNPDAIQYTAAG